MIRLSCGGDIFLFCEITTNPEETMTLEEFDKYEKIRKHEQERKKKEWEKRASKILNDWIDTWIDEPDTQPTKNQ